MPWQNEIDRSRLEMIKQQLQGRGIRDKRVLAAMAKVPRELFVPEDEKFEAYADRALSLDCGQTISSAVHRGFDDGSPGTHRQRIGLGNRHRQRISSGNSLRACPIGHQPGASFRALGEPHAPL